VDEQHVLQVWELRPHRQHLALEQRGRRDEDARARFRQSRDDWIRTKCREERRVDAGILERTERCDVQRRYPSEQRGNHVTFADTKAPQEIRKPARVASQVIVRDVLSRAAATKPANGDPPCRLASGVSIDSFMRDIQAATAR
jgi:hypothetical protein